MKDVMKEGAGTGLGISVARLWIKYVSMGQTEVLEKKCPIGFLFQISTATQIDKVSMGHSQWDKMAK